MASKASGSTDSEHTCGVATSSFQNSQQGSSSTNDTDPKNKSVRGGYTCCVPGCNSNTKQDQELSFHKFPRDGSLNFNQRLSSATSSSLGSRPLRDTPGMSLTQLKGGTGCHPTGERDIKDLAVMCNNDERGCKWEGELQSLEDHLTTCSYAVVGCPNECENKELLRVNLQDHLQNECPKRKYECSHCHAVDTYDYIMTEHQSKCPLIEVPCPNQCGLTPIRGNLGKHRNECPNEVIGCRYADIDCKVKRPRKDMEEHEGDSMLHLHLAVDTVARLNRFQQQEQTPVLSMPRFEMKRSRGELWNSPPFYTQPGGYRMSISIDANGYGDGEGTHVSVYVFLMWGKNDDNLSWPFRGEVTITLLNQLADENHYTYTIMYPEDMDDNSNRRVIVDSDMGEGYGEECFIAHDQLGHDAANNCQYLKDDCLYFRITAKAADPVKSWLTCTV